MGVQFSAVLNAWDDATRFIISSMSGGRGGGVDETNIDNAQAAMVEIGGEKCASAYTLWQQAVALSSQERD
jgi:hypothetical protein